jgi:hypothetical protein
MRAGGFAFDMGGFALGRAARNRVVANDPAPSLPAQHVVEQWTIDRVKPYARNSRLHPKKQIEQLKASIKRFGFTIPLLLREDGTIIAGHGRFEAAQALGLKDVPIIVARGWSELQCEEYTIADNKLSSMSTWDDDVLAEELKRISLLSADSIDGLGFSDKEIAKILGEEKDTSPQLDGMSYSVIVRCKDEAQQAELLEQFEAH